ncbi:RHS repeat-associated core domain-containing protein [Chryseobacterium sp. JM1]|uniref:RHS repeat-associated core domain-containing protein n=1 Tax=Chryseobacterium sp. JM1 TaxID=1233950 RepID=UPI0004E791CF|nr:DUF4329 domain-containing protein [Chryseobacterium sp. JM1]KFF22681.1 hypothetical protein IW22_00015 [Chryseobacterium sp. JM1]
MRISFGRNSAGALEITDANDYYPFGMNHLKTGNAFFGQNTYKNYKFQEQELQETGFYSFKWRNYMPDVGRFFNIDPLAEKYPTWGPYVFSGNRVIDARELEGLEPYLLYGSSDEAAENFAQQYNGVSIVNSIELKTTLYSQQKEGKNFYSYVTPVGFLELDEKGNPKPGTSVNASIDIPEGTKKEGDAHTHGADLINRVKNYTENDNVFNDFDKNVARGNGDWSKRSTQYVVTPNGLLLVYDPNLNAPSNRKGNVLKTSKPIPSDPLSPTRKNKISPEVQPVVPPVVIDSNGESAQLNYKFKEEKKRQ